MSRHLRSQGSGSSSHDPSIPLPTITTPRKRQAQGTGLLTPPDSHQKHTHDAAEGDSARKGEGSAKRRRLDHQPDPPTAPFPTPAKTPRKIVLRVGGRKGTEAVTSSDVRAEGIPTPESTKHETVDSSQTQQTATPNPTLTPNPKESQKSKQKTDDRTPWKRTDVLPPHLANLLSLHKSFDLALSLHIATHPPVLPPPPAGTAGALGTAGAYGKEMDVRLEALTNYVAMRPIVEKSCGKRFGLSELKRLMWLWSAPNSSTTTDDNPFIDAPPSENPTGCYTVSPTRTLDPPTSRRIHTYGFGLRIRLSAREAASYVNTLHVDGDGGVGTVGAVARWSAGSEARLRVVEGRLWEWVRRHGGLEGEPLDESKIPHIPCAALPQLQPAIGNLMPSFGIPAPASPSRLAGTTSRSSPLASEIKGGLLPPPAFRSGSVHQRLQAVAAGTASESDAASTGVKRGAAALEEDVFGPVLMIPKEGKAAGSAETRQRALFERIKARSSKDTPGLSRPVMKGRLGTQGMSRLQMQDELKRRSTLSRLEGVAEAVWMFFSLSPSNTGSLASPGSSPRTKRRAFPVSDVIDVVVKSSKTPISGPEAYDSLVLLTQLCPSFLILRTIARQEWLEMPAAAHQVASPGAKMNLAGPASPGKVVVRGGGGSLREVRERIRRELGDL